MGEEEERDPQRLKRIAAAAYDYDNDPRWAEYWSNVVIPPHMAARSDVVDHFKRKFYQRFIIFCWFSVALVNTMKIYVFSAVHAKLKREKKIEKRKQAKAREAAIKRALDLGEEAKKKVPRTIENTREVDETVCRPDDEELFAGNDADEFSQVLKQQVTPKILITTNRFNSTRGPAFIQELLSVIPNAHYHKRGTYELKKIVEYAKNKDFTSVVVVHSNRREPDALLIINLPDGPTAHFKLSKLVLRKDIKNHGNPTDHKPELVLNNFTTRLGHRVGRYIFETKEKKDDSKDKAAKSKNVPQEKMIVRLQECGPRFTLKLRNLQHGTFDSKGGEYEWVHKPEMDTSRRRFFL
ncbi:Brix [Musa troglodytarum]|uniref:Brix n=1 Tax=Musa troglodytarum TaxID=320322 RepID=A0A9E7I3Y9_9LILI|nr:Brix [Musa troglodytarum]